MWPGDQQSGGERYPQGTPPNPPQYPPSQQPPQGPAPQQQPPQSPYAQPQPPAPPAGAPANPYAQPGPPQQPGQGFPNQSPPQPQPGPYPPNPYQQQTPGFGAPQPPYGSQPGYPQQPFGPGGPGAGPPQKDGRSRTTVIVAIVAAVAVIAAVAVGVAVFGGGKGKPDAKDTTSTVTAKPKPTSTTASPSTPGSDDGGQTDNPRGAPDSVDIKPVIPGWKVVRRGARNVAFDVPPDWTVDEEGLSIGFSDKSGKPEVVMGAPAYYKHDWCSTGGDMGADRAAVGTKGGAGAKSLRQAAESEAEAWAYWAYQDNGKGTFSKAQNSKEFHDAYGISGWQAQATATKLPKSNKCSPPSGIAYTVAWLDPAQKTPTAVVWVLYADTGVKDQLSQSIVDKIKSTIRPIKK